MKKFIKALSVVLVVVLSAVILTGCVPSSVDQAERKLEKQGYSVIVYSESSVLIPNNAVGGIYAKKGKIANGGIEDITAYYFPSVKAAKTYVSGKTNMVQKGRWVFYLYTDNALEDFIS